MTWKPAVIRAFRTALQGCVATLLAFYTAVAGDGTFVNIKARGSVLAFGLFLTAVAALISLLQNLLEDNTEAGRKAPKG